MSALLTLLRRFWDTEPAWFLAGVGASAATVLAGMALLGLSGWFITASALAGIAGAGLMFDFFRPSAGIRFLALARTGGRYGERLVTHDATLRFLTALRVDLLRGIARRGGNAGRRGAEMLQRLTGDIDALDNLYLRIALPLIVLGLVGGVLIASLALFGVALALPAAVVLATGLAVAIGAGLVSRTDARRRALALEALRIRTVDLVRVQAELAVAGSLGAQRRAVIRAADAAAAAARRLARVELASHAALSLLGAGALLAALLIGAERYRAGAIDGPQLVLVLIVTFAALECLGSLRRGALEIGRTALAARRIAPLLPEPAADERMPRRAIAGAKDASDAAVRFDAVTFRFAPDRAPVVRNVTFVLRPGERVAVTGASGSGKSTLLALVAGLLTPEWGRVRIAGRPAVLGNADVGFLTQRTELFRDSIAANLRIAAPDATDAALWAALETVELADLVRALPGGLETVLGEGGAGLSGGEARRLALARIVLRAPRVWLLDEPTAGLDEAQGARVMANVMRAAGDASVLVAAHHTRETEAAGRVLRLSTGGRIDWN